MRCFHVVLPFGFVYSFIGDFERLFSRFGNFWIFGRGGVENPSRRADVEERSLRKILYERYDNRKNGQE